MSSCSVYHLPVICSLGSTAKNHSYFFLENANSIICTCTNVLETKKSIHKPAYNQNYQLLWSSLLVYQICYLSKTAHKISTAEITDQQDHRVHLQHDNFCINYITNELYVYKHSWRAVRVQLRLKKTTLLSKRDISLQERSTTTGNDCC